MAVHDRLRQAGRARREEDAERMREGQGLELERLALREERVPGDGVRKGIVRAARVRDVDDGFEAGQTVADLGHLLAAIDRLVSVAVSGDCEQDLGLQLAEPVKDAADAELRRARGPDRPQARGGDEGDERLRDVGQVGDDAVAGTDAEPLQAGPGARDLLPEVPEGELLRRSRLRERDHCDRVEILVATDQVLRVVQAGAGEPLRARHLAGAEDALVRRVRTNLEEVPDRSPEALEVGDRPLPQLVVAGEVETPFAAAASRGSGRARTAPVASAGGVQSTWPCVRGRSTDALTRAILDSTSASARVSGANRAPNRVTRHALQRRERGDTG